MLALSTVTFSPAVVFAAASTNTNRSSQSKNYVAPVTETIPQNETTTTSEVAAAHTAQTETDQTQSSVSAEQTAAKTADPAGNNGTVKIDRAPFDSDPNNEPHVTCSFQVDFYGYDKGVGNADVQFELQPPTKDGRTLTVVTGDLTPNIGEDAAGGGTDVDAQETYTLKFTGAPHEKQGYHVKLTVHAPGSQGADVKHKVFWVQPCNDQNGHVLSEETTKGGNGQALPETMPSTGASAVLTTIGTITAAGAAYLATLYRAQLRKLI
jgi:hypothetical protein